MTVVFNIVLGVALGILVSLAAVTPSRNDAYQRGWGTGWQRCSETCLGEYERQHMMLCEDCNTLGPSQPPSGAEWDPCAAGHPSMCKTLGEDGCVERGRYVICVKEQQQQSDCRPLPGLGYVCG